MPLLVRAGPPAIAVAALVTALAVVPASAATGYYTLGQAAAGARVYATHCAGCHGARLQGGGNAPSLRADAIAPSETVGGFSRFMIDTMPPGRPGSLGPAECASVIAFLLREGGFRAGTVPLTQAAALKIGERYNARRRVPH